jgi:hypothetical protein
MAVYMFYPKYMHTTSSDGDGEALRGDPRCGHDLLRQRWLRVSNTYSVPLCSTAPVATTAHLTKFDVLLLRF